MNDKDVKQSMMRGKDLCITIGGDSTYLRAAAVIDNPYQPILGINGDPTRRLGFLTDA